MAPWLRGGKISAGKPGIRLVVWAALLERHDATVGEDRSAAVALRGNEARRASGQSGHAHNAVHRASGEVSRARPRQAVFPLPRLQHAAHAGAHGRPVSRQVARGALRRRDPDHRLVGRRGDEDAQAHRPRQKHTCHIHQRQRAVAEPALPHAAKGKPAVARRVARAVERPQGYAARGRGAGAVHPALAGSNRGRPNFRRDGGDARLVCDAGDSRWRKPAQAQNRRTRPAAFPVWQNQVVAAQDSFLFQRQRAGGGSRRAVETAR